MSLHRSLITPTFHGGVDRADARMKEIFEKVPWEPIYGETGVQQAPANTLVQAGLVGDEYLVEIEAEAEVS